MEETKTNIAARIGCTRLSLPQRLCEGVVSKVSKRLEFWKQRLFSLGGRIILIQACLSSIPLYYLSLFKISVWVFEKIGRYMRRFYGRGQGGAYGSFVEIVGLLLVQANGSFDVFTRNLVLCGRG